MIFRIFVVLAIGLPFYTSGQFKLMVLGTAQDGGYPQAGCQKKCCAAVWNGESERHFVSSLAIYNEDTRDVYFVDCSPDFKEQLHLVEEKLGGSAKLRSIFLTHAHMGHYLGLADLGREVMGSEEVAVVAMPRMTEFLKTNGPWNQLEELNNIKLVEIDTSVRMVLGDKTEIVVLPVPHRDEYSETIAYLFKAPEKQILYLPDIDKWEKWDVDIRELVRKSDMVFIDGTFFSEDELPGRDMSEIPHPFVVESMELFKDLSKEEKSRIHFTHFNHSNPLHFRGEAYQEVKKAGFNVAEQGSIIDLEH